MIEMKDTFLDKIHQKQRRSLNRRIIWTEDGSTVDGDDDHVMCSLNEWRLEECNGLATPFLCDIDEIRRN